MSFYGNSYQYLAETFARIILKNTGINNPEFTTLLPNEVGPINISATEVDSGLAINSGNQWIALKPIYETENPLVPHGFEIWHNAPSDSGTLTKIVPDAKSEVPEAVAKKAIDLNFEDYLKLPIITYDEAGHSLATDEASYYKLPSDPSGPFYNRLWLVDGINPKGESIEPEGGSLKRKLLDRMNSIDGCNDSGTYQEGETQSLYYRLEDDMENLHDRVDEWDDKIINAEQAASDAEQSAAEANRAVGNLANRLETDDGNIMTSNGNTVQKIQADIEEINRAIVKIMSLIS